MTRKSPFQNKTHTRWHPALLAATIIGGTILFVYAVHLFQQELVPPHDERTVVDKLDPVLEATVNAIAAKFICACGNCGDKSLDVCTCPEAVKEREMIRRYLRAGQLPGQVTATINELFGGLKPEVNVK